MRQEKTKRRYHLGERHRNRSMQNSLFETGVTDTKMSIASLNLLRQIHVYQLNAGGSTMNQCCVFLCLLLNVFVFHIKGQSTEEASPDPGDAGNGFQPSLAVVIGILCVMFSLTFILLIYGKLCHRYHSAAQMDVENRPRFRQPRSRFSGSGIDKSIIESLPFFKFSSLSGTREGLECAVCLSKFEDIEILRLLPKCKHAFHTNCIDHWLESHSSCPLCRQKVSAEDPTLFTFSNSLRFLSNPSEPREDSNIEFFVQREETQEGGSSRFCVGSSFRKIEKGGNEDTDSLIRKEAKYDLDYDGKFLHKHHHRILVSDIVFKHRWSSVSSSDMMFLNSEMLNAMSSTRFASMDSGNEQTSIEGAEVQDTKAADRKILFESKVDALPETIIGPPSSKSTRNSSYTSRHNNPAEKRSMSEITAVSRYKETAQKNAMLKENTFVQNNAREAITRRLWLSIARRTVEWFSNREKRAQQSRNTEQN